MHRTLFKFACLIAAVVALPLPAHAKKSKVRNDVFLGPTAEAFLLSNYKSYRDHKAFAIGPAAYWGYTWGHKTKKGAAKAALAGCVQGLKNSPHKSLRNRRCAIYDINGKKVFAGKDRKFPFGSILSGSDRPLKKAIYNKGPRGETKGILLYVHGCNRSHRSVFNRNAIWGKWANQFHSMGLRMVAPNSFADKRPGEMCGPALLPPRLERIRSFLYRYRVAQTKRTLSVLKKRYPGLPIFIWGHSEGGKIVQFLDDKVAGVVVTGHECGLSNIGFPLTDKNVPLLVFMGTNDKYVSIPGGRTDYKIKRHCNKVLPNKLWNYVILPGIGHFPSVESKAVRDPLRGFILRGLKASSAGVVE